MSAQDSAIWMTVVVLHVENTCPIRRRPDPNKPFAHTHKPTNYREICPLNRNVCKGTDTADAQGPQSEILLLQLIAVLTCCSISVGHEPEHLEPKPGQMPPLGTFQLSVMLEEMVPATVDANSHPPASRRTAKRNLNNLFVNSTAARTGRKAEVSASVGKYPDFPRNQKLDFLFVLLCLALILQSNTLALPANFCNTVKAFSTQQCALCGKYNVKEKYSRKVSSKLSSGESKLNH